MVKIIIDGDDVFLLGGFKSISPEVLSITTFSKIVPLNFVV